ncbi:hypothetical protein TYRP_005349 [Tyrophagus putrescentiae]|nr:hypothetical protein TYRP_005349 [Tyrophagus putrescentiae]
MYYSPLKTAITTSASHLASRSQLNSAININLPRSQLHSSASSHHFNLNRARSPSPTQFYQQTAVQLDHQRELVYTLNSFIFRGIERGFLDKQAVRDLLIAYDAEEIFTEGEEAFFRRFQAISGPEAIHFGRRDTRQLVAGAEEDQRRRLRARGFYRKGFGQRGPSNHDANSQNDDGDGDGESLTAATASASKKKKRAGLWTRPRSNLWTAFFAAISIKIFQSNVEKKATASAAAVAAVNATVELGVNVAALGGGKNGGTTSSTLNNLHVY